MSRKANLIEAKKNKNDEFYTRMEDINSELKHYEKHFKDKTILMNCDDPTWSNFWRYFHIEFERLGLKKIISTHYEKGEVASYKMEYEGGNDNDIEVGVRTDLEQNGDFRSPECVELLKEADIVVTNPPFSLFREYIALLMKYNKKFIIIGNKNAITYKEFFPLLKDNKVWIGYESPSEFNMPNGMTKKVFCGWFTNLDIKKQHEWLETTYLYSKKDDLYPDLYPKYDNYDAINVDKIKEIPMDYDGVMGVPITFLDKYNPEQFEIVGLAPEREIVDVLRIKKYINAIQYNDPNSKAVREGKKGITESGNRVNCGPTILHDTKPSKYPYYTSETVPNKFIEVLYARILIRKKFSAI